jgi:hypothetical protein
VRRLYPLMTLFVLTTAAATPSTDDDDAVALTLPVESLSDSHATGAWSLVSELALTDSALQAGGHEDAQRLSFDVRFDQAFAGQWRAVLSDRLDLLWPGSFIDGRQINTLKETYVSWQPQSDLILDAGRINVRQGVALGYNPTDFLRADALRTVDSIDPDSLRSSRLGTVMVRAEKLWAGGALTALYAPGLTHHQTSADWDPDLGATNHSNRWMLALSQHLVGTWSPQWTIFSNGTGQPQFGWNTTAAIDSATVAFLELSTGWQRSQWQEALQRSAGNTWHSSAVFGATHDFVNKLSVSLEFEYDDAAPGQHQWAQARRGAGRLYGLYRQYAQMQQDLTTRCSAFGYVSWQDLVIQHLDLAGFIRRDLVDHSMLPWLSLRYHWSHVDAAVQWQAGVGGVASDYGASLVRHSWQLILDYYL